MRDTAPVSYTHLDVYKRQPIAFSLGASALVGFLLTGTPILALGQHLTIAVAKFSLLALPFFIFSGNLMDQDVYKRQV